MTLQILWFQSIHASVSSLTSEFHKSANSYLNLTKKKKSKKQNQQGRIDSLTSRILKIDRQTTYNRSAKRSLKWNEVTYWDLYLTFYYSEILILPLHSLNDYCTPSRNTFFQSTVIFFKQKNTNHFWGLIWTPPANCMNSYNCSVTCLNYLGYTKIMDPVANLLNDVFFTTEPNVMR